MGISLAAVEEHAGRARGRLADAGAVVVEERLGLEAAFWSQLAGQSRMAHAAWGNQLPQLRRAVQLR